MANLFLTGSGVPTNAVGEVSDYYRDTATNLIYYRAALGWEVVPSLVPTPDGVGTNWLFGTGAPDNGIGSANDYYRDDANGIIYRKHITSGWEAKGELDFIGVYGVQWGEGTGAPANIESLNNLPAGSFYLDVSTSDIYYKDNTLTWSLKGQLGGGGGGGGNVTCTIADLPLATAASKNTFYRITDLGTGSAVFVSNGLHWLPVGEVLLKTGNVDSIVTGVTDETTLATFTMPKKLASPNMTIVVNAAWTTNATAGVKNTRIRFGGDIVSNPTHNGATFISMQYETLIRFRNSLSNQFAYGVTVPGSYTPTSAASVFLTKDMSAETGSDVDIVLTGQVPALSDNITLRGYTITLRG